MELLSTSTTIERDRFTGENEEHTLFYIETTYGNFDIEVIDKEFNGVVEIEAAEWNIEVLEMIYNHFDEQGDYELYLDSTERYAYLDITTYGCPEDLDEILEDIEKILEDLENAPTNKKGV